jgi:hypothetical protein
MCACPTRVRSMSRGETDVADPTKADADQMANDLMLAYRGLLRCLVCGAAVADLDTHQKWHGSFSGVIGLISLLAKGETEVVQEIADRLDEALRERSEKPGL